MTNNYIKAGIILILIMLLLGGCKKYEEGPWLSLRSKNARIIGNWQLTEYSGTTHQINNQGETTTVVSFDGEYMSYNDEKPRLYNEELVLEKGGVFNRTIINDGETIVFSGLWTWIDGKPNKTQIEYGNRIYTITRLKNKELILYYYWKTDQTSGNNIDIYTVERIYTYVQ